MAVSDCFVSVVAPVCDQASIVDAFIPAVMQVLRQSYCNYELVLVDDGSQDDTVAKITSHLTSYECIRLIRLSRRFGEQIAIWAGLESAIGDFIVVMRPDSDPPELIPSIVQKARAGAGLVLGIRNERFAQPLFQKAGAALFYWYCRKILHLNLPKNSTPFAVLTRQVLSALVQIKDSCRYLPLLGLYIGYGNETFVYRPLDRTGQSKSRDFSAAVKLAIDVITSTSRHPLQFVTRIGILASVLNMLYSVYVIAIYLFKAKVAEGWTTVSLQNAAMFFFIFLILTVLSEYMGYILAQSQGRPLYYVLEERNSSALFADRERKNLVKESGMQIPEEINGGQRSGMPSN